MRMKAIALLVLCCVLATGCSANQPDALPARDSVYQLLAAREEANVIGDFTREFGAEVDASFWQREYGGSTPQQELDERVEASRAEVLALFARGNELGLIPFRDFDGFFADLEAENARRAADRAAGRTVYGPEQFTAAAYLDYLISRLRQHTDQN